MRQHRLNTLSNNRRLPLAQETPEQCQQRWDTLANNRRQRIAQHRQSLGPYHLIARHVSNVEINDIGALSIECINKDAQYVSQMQVKRIFFSLR